MRLLGIAMLAGALTGWAQVPADPVTVFRAQLTGPSGVTTQGKLVTVGDRLIFVDDDRPNESFAINKADVRRLTMENGGLTADLGRPFTDRFGSRTNLVLRTTEPEHMDALVRWAGIPLTGGGAIASIRTDESREVTQVAPGTSTTAAVGTVRTLDLTQPLMFEARHDHAVGHCTGRLIVRDDGMQYESVTEPGHSRGWKWSEINSLDRNTGEGKIILKPYHGDNYTLKLNKTLEDPVYQLITDRIVASRPRR